jgi:hypothetical protein
MGRREAQRASTKARTATAAQPRRITMWRRAVPHPLALRGRGKTERPREERAGRKAILHV